MVAVCRRASLPPFGTLPIAQRVADLALAEKMGRGRGFGFGAGVGTGPAMSVEAFAEEERRVHRVALRDLASSERLNRYRRIARHLHHHPILPARLVIDAAFSLQMERVEADWAVHFEQLLVDYLARRGDIAGSTVEKRTVQTPSVSGSLQSKEKQTLLIHTAPVFTPTTEAMEPSSLPSGLGHTAYEEEATAMLQLEGAFEAAKAR